MQISPILYQYQTDKYADVIKDYKSVVSAVESKEKHNNSVVFEGVPMYGRVNSVPEKIENKDYIPAMSLVSLAVMNGPEDLRDVMNSYKQIKEGFPEPKTYHSGYDNKYAQHPFSFFRGTIFSEYLNPNSKECPNPEKAAWIINHDKTLWDTKFGKWVKEKLGIEVDDVVTDIEDIVSTSNNPKKVIAKKFTANNSAKDTIARAMTRTTTFGALTMAGIEAAHVAKEVSEGKNFFAETGKSILSLGTTIAATGILGAIGAKHYGPTGSLVGMGLGAITGAAVGRFMD